MLKKILVVDNPPVTLKLLAQLLQKRGYQVLTAESGLAALDFLKTENLDVVFTDLIMPTINGEKLCQIIRRIPKFKDLPLPAFIPERYVSDLNTRLSLYQRMVKADRVEQVEAMSQEFADRFGAPPEEVQNLLYALRIKILAAKAGIESISTEDSQIVLRRFEGIRFDRQELEPLLRGLRLPAGSFHLDALQLRLHPRRLGRDWQKVLEEVLKHIS